MTDLFQLIVSHLNWLITVGFVCLLAGLFVPRYIASRQIRSRRDSWLHTIQNSPIHDMWRKNSARTVTWTCISVMKPAWTTTTTSTAVPDSAWEIPDDGWWLNIYAPVHVYLDMTSLHLSLWTIFVVTRKLKSNQNIKISSGVTLLKLSLPWKNSTELTATNAESNFLYAT